MGADYSNTKDTNRESWIVKYPAAMLADAAAKQRDFRQSRVDWWIAERDKLIQEARESGLEIIESVASQISTYTTNNSGPKIVVRDDIQKKLGECQSKISSHQRAVELYSGWAQFMEAIDSRKVPNQPHTLFDLTFSDWLFFFGKY